MRSRICVLLVSLVMATDVGAQPLPFVESFEPGFRLWGMPEYGWSYPAYNPTSCIGTWAAESGAVPDGSAALRLVSMDGCTSMGPAFCFDRDLASSAEIGVEVWVNVPPTAPFEVRVGGLMNSDYNFCCQPHVYVWNDSARGGQLSIGNEPSPIRGPMITEGWHLLRLELRGPSGTDCNIYWDGEWVAGMRGYGVRGLRLGLLPGAFDGVPHEVRYDNLRVIDLANEPIPAASSSTSTLKRRY